MASRFACCLRPSLFAATAATATVMESFHIRMRHISVSSPTPEKPRPTVWDSSRTLPSLRQFSDPHFNHMLVCGCGAPRTTRRLFQSMVCESPDSNPFVSFSVQKSSPDAGNQSSVKEKRAEKEHLLNVLHHAENVMPLFFDATLFFLKYNPPQLYTPNVIFENHLKTPVKTTKGIVSLNFYQYMFRLNYQLRYMLRKLVILNTWIDEGEATVNIHFRILCCRKANLVGTPPSKVDEAVRKMMADHAEWHDYILTFHVTNKNRVWKVIITQKASERPPKVHRPVRAFLSRLRRRLPPQPVPVPV